jgi:hypothetical protein
MRSTNNRGHRHEVERDDAECEEGVATGSQDAQLHADVSIEELAEEIEHGPAHDRDHTPRLSGGDVDAGWDQADSGEETVGGSSPTPDQDQVDELGAALGVTYSDTEPLHTTEKLEKRDDTRWELDPASAEDYEERQRLERENRGRR